MLQRGRTLGFLGTVPAPVSTSVSGGTTVLVNSLPMTDNGLDAVRATLDQMVRLVRKYRSDQTTAETARAIIRMGGITDQRPQGQRRQVINLLQNWVRDHIIYVYDPTETEWIQTPPKTLSLGTGDCDDKITLLLALLESVGYNTELLAVGGQGGGWDPTCAPPAPGMLPAYSHVMGAVRYGPVTGRLPDFLDGWLTLETIVKGAGPGYRPPGIRVIMPRRVS